MAEHPGGEGPRDVLLALIVRAVIEGKLTEDEANKPLDALLRDHRDVLEAGLAGIEGAPSLDQLVVAVLTLPTPETATPTPQPTPVPTPPPGETDEDKEERLRGVPAGELEAFIAPGKPPEWPATSSGEASEELARFSGFLSTWRLQQELIGVDFEEGATTLTDKLFNFSDMLPFEDRTWIDLLNEETQTERGASLLAQAQGFADAATELQKDLYRRYLQEVGQRLPVGGPGAIADQPDHPAFETFFSWLDRNHEAVNRMSRQRAVETREKDVVRALKQERELGNLSQWFQDRREEIVEAARSRQVAQVPGVVESLFPLSPFQALADPAASPELRAALSGAFPQGPVLPREGESQLAYMERVGAILSDILARFPDPATAPSADALVASAIGAGFVLTLPDLQQLGAEEQARVLDERAAISNLSPEDQAIFRAPATSAAERARLIEAGRQAPGERAALEARVAFERGIAGPVTGEGSSFNQLLVSELGGTLTAAQVRLLSGRRLDVLEAFKREQTLRTGLREQEEQERRTFQEELSEKEREAQQAFFAALPGGLPGEPSRRATAVRLFTEPSMEARPITLAGFLQQQGVGLARGFEEEEEERKPSPRTRARGIAQVFRPRE